MLGQVLHQFLEDHEARDLVRECSLQKVTSASCAAHGPGELQASEIGVSTCAVRGRETRPALRGKSAAGSPRTEISQLYLGCESGMNRGPNRDEETQREVDRDSETAREIDQEIE